MTLKKNKATRAASVLLVLVLMTMSFLSGILAKYVITDGAVSTARVAKFGVVTSVEGSLFGTSYTIGTDNSNANQIQAWSLNKQSASVSGTEATTTETLLESSASPADTTNWTKVKIETRSEIYVSKDNWLTYTGDGGGLTWSDSDSAWVASSPVTVTKTDGDTTSLYGTYTVYAVFESDEESDDYNILAPGTKNETGMTISVTGTPEVSTMVILDYPEGDGTTGTDNADFVNTDIYLNDGAYYIMQAVYANSEPSSDSEGYPVVTVTTDNDDDYYYLTAGSTTTSGTFTNTKVYGTDYQDEQVLYKAVQLTSTSSSDSNYMNASNNSELSDPTGASVNRSAVWHDGAYYPIQWTVTTNDTEAVLDSTANDVDGVMSAIGSGWTAGSSALGDGYANKYYKTFTPNVDLGSSSNVGTRTITWEWAYGTAWTDSTSNDVTLQNWENTTIEDLADTALGEMAAQAVDYAASTGTGALDEYIVAYMDGSTLTEVKYAEVKAASDSANTAIYAYAGDAPTAGTYTDVVACLTETFGARLTVAQID